jgi:hypothetical protein
MVSINASDCQRDIGSHTTRVDSCFESLGGTLPLVRQVKSLFFALWCSNWSVVQFDSGMHCSVTCHSRG